jgi:phosphate transport system substrate-binding protein
MSKDGYLARKGLVALPKAEADKIATAATGMQVLAAADVK